MRPGTDWYNEDMKEALKVLEENNLIWEICVDMPNLRLAKNMVKENPSVKFTLNHCGADMLGRHGEEAF